MRAFICAFAGFSVAVPMGSVSSLMLYSGVTAKTFARDPQDENLYVSLPLLFKCPLEEIRHGIILKSGNSDDFDETAKNKIILLTTNVECEMEIQPELIYALPKIFSLSVFSVFFNGILFNKNKEADHPMLFLNTEKLVENIQKESTV